MSCESDCEPIGIITKYIPIFINQKLELIGFGRLLAGKLTKDLKLRVTNCKN